MNVSLARLRWRYCGGWRGLLGVVLGCLFGAAFFFAGYFARQTEEDFAASGVAATATVTGKDKRVESTSPQRGGTKTVYSLRYRYRDDRGGTHNGSYAVDASTWNQSQQGRTVAIEYLRDRPGTSRVTVGRSSFDRWAYLGALIIGGVILVGVLGLSAFGVVKAGRLARLVRDGEPILGSVTGHETETSKDGKPAQSHHLQYTFTGRDGTERTGTSVWLSKRLMERWPVDEPILVLQDATDPNRFEADVFEARPDDLARLRGATES